MIDDRFLKESAHVLRNHYLPKIREAVERLSDEQIWHRTGDASNAVGNILLHMVGNIRQHIIAGVGGAPDERNRPLEFAARGGVPKAVLLANLEKTIGEAADVLEKFNPELLLEERVIQGNRVALMNDIYHVVEHFAYHAGQIIFVSKAIADRGFDWYKYLDPRP